MLQIQKRGNGDRRRKREMIKAERSIQGKVANEKRSFTREFLLPNTYIERNNTTAYKFHGV